MTPAASSLERVTVDGKCFRLGDRKFPVKGVTYGPFAPDAAGDAFADAAQTARDFAQLRELGANLIRVYHPPPRWLLDLAAAHGLKVFVDLPWDKHQCFLDTPARRAAAREYVRTAVAAGAGHPAVFAYSVVNEIAPDIVRWAGARAVADFIDELVAVARTADPYCLCTFANYPPTEFLRPRSPDFVCFNVYLHERAPFANYLARLQMIADTKPLLLGEFGLDARREGAARQAATLAWQIEAAFQGGLAGVVVFSFTDDWWHAGRPVTDWAMGLTGAAREPKPAFAAVQREFRRAPYFPRERSPRVSVVVASYNGARTLRPCLESLGRLNYPNYEVILVDDGSQDDSARIAAAFPMVRFLPHGRNLGLSVARNTGIAAATGEIVAFTDSDCRADEDWLYYLVGDLLAGDFAGIGGHNFLPPEDSCVAAAVMVSPGGPAHVMLTDREAEHIPGCNMAFYKWALEEIHGFDPLFTKAGDDVDLCWRLQQRGRRIGFSPAGFVWHHRRSTVRAYLRQQRGYGEAEALLVRKHPEYFSALGGGIWRGRIYAAAQLGVGFRPPIIYHGAFAGGLFQTLYTAPPAGLLGFFLSLEYHGLVTLPLLVLAPTFEWLRPLAAVAPGLSLGTCLAAGLQAGLPRERRRWWSRPLIALLFLLQPIVRGWARYQGRLVRPAPSGPPGHSLESLARRHSPAPLGEIEFWAAGPVERIAFVAGVQEQLTAVGWPHKADLGWSDFDLLVFGGRWLHLQMTTVAEDYPERRRRVRCRLRGVWSPAARMGFWSVTAAGWLLAGWLTPGSGYWRWCLPLLAPLALLGWMRREERDLQSRLVILLEGVAHRWGMHKPSPPAHPGGPPTAHGSGG